MQVFGIFDSKVGGFLQPIFAANSGSVVRQLLNTMYDRNHDFYRHSEDYTLFKLADFDIESGAFASCMAPESIVTLSVLKSQVKDN